MAVVTPDQHPGAGDHGARAHGTPGGEFPAQRRLPGDGTGLVDPQVPGTRTKGGWVGGGRRSLCREGDAGPGDQQQACEHRQTARGPTDPVWRRAHSRATYAAGRAGFCPSPTTAPPASPLTWNRSPALLLQGALIGCDLPSERGRPLQLDILVQALVGSPPEDGGLRSVHQIEIAEIDPLLDLSRLAAPEQIRARE